jgi:gas vesicle protein
MKNSGASLNQRIIEAWINETLKDAEHLDIPGVILKPVHKQPMNRYQIDRLFLHSSGISIESIDRIFRGLFVYSIGFYEMILRCVQHAKNKYSIMSSLWKVFQILLEYCCKSNYQMLIAKISNEHKSHVDHLEEEFNREKEIFNNNEKSLKEQLEEYSIQNSTLLKQLDEE